MIIICTVQCGELGQALILKTLYSLSQNSICHTVILHDCMTEYYCLTKYCMIIKVLSTTVWLSTKYCMLFVMTAAGWWLCGLGRKTRRVQCCYKMLTGCCLATAGRSSLYALCKYCTDCTLYTQICFSLYSILSAVMISVTATATTTTTTAAAAQ